MTQQCEDHLPVASDRPPRTALELVTGDRKPAPVDADEPIRPEWLRDRSTFWFTVKNFTKRNGYRSAKWAWYLPQILALLASYAPRGLTRVVAAVSRYLYDRDSAETRHEVHHDPGEYARVSAVRRANLEARWTVAGGVAVSLVAPVLAWTYHPALYVLVGLAFLVWLRRIVPSRGLREIGVGFAAGVALPLALGQLPRPPAWALWALLAAVVLALGWHGRPRDKTLIHTPALRPGLVEPLRAPVVLDALCALGNSKMKQPEQIRLLSDPVRCGQGYQVDLELPAAVPATLVIERREAFAAALRRELGCVWPSVGLRHPGHLRLYVSDQPMVQQTQRPWPLLKSGKVDLFEPQPMFTDQRGDWVCLQLLGGSTANMVIGSLPRMGKTFLLRQALLVAGLDPRAKVYVLDGKGTGDLAPCALFAHFYSRGTRPEQVERVRAAVRELLEELDRRTDVIDGLSHQEAPESKVTSVLADRKDLDLVPTVVGIDETQMYFQYGDHHNKEHKLIRQELEAGVTKLMKLGPALGMFVALATQQVNRQTMPTSVSNNAAIRACLRIFGQDPNDRILGTGAYRKGVDATQFSPEDVGILYLSADGHQPQIVRTVAGLDAPASEPIASRARAYRESARLLSGDAAGEETGVEAEQVSLLADVRSVMDAPGQHGQNMSLNRIREALGEVRPDLYVHLDNDALGGLLRGAGVAPASIYCPYEGRSMRGVKRSWLDVAATADEEPDDDTGGSAPRSHPARRDLTPG